MSSLRYAPHLRRHLALTISYAALLIFTEVAGSTGPASTIAGFAWIALLFALGFMDARGVVSLGGLIHYERMTWGSRITVVGALMLLFPFAIAVYLVRSLFLSIREGQRIMKEQPERIAKLERELGV